MGLLDEYVARAIKENRDDFAAPLPHLFLLLKLTLQERGNDDWSFKTRTVVPAERDGWDSSMHLRADRYRVFALVKGSRNPWPERISVGRARNNDVVLPDSSVSKLHAYFSKQKNGGMVVQDAGSRNGTRVNDTQLTEGQQMPVHVGDSVMLGALAFSLIDAHGLHDLLQTVLGKRG